VSVIEKGPGGVKPDLAFFCVLFLEVNKLESHPDAESSYYF
jgi:hypothetical protein